MNHTTDTPRTEAFGNNLVKCYCPRCIVGAHDDIKLAAQYRKHAEWRERAEKAEAEVAKLNHQLLKSENDLLQSQDINSFLDTEFRIACKRAEKAEAEAIQSKAQLNQALAIATEAHEVIGQFFRGIDYTRIGMEIYELKKSI
jgi:hypothetical protein